MNIKLFCHYNYLGKGNPKAPWIHVIRLFFLFCLKSHVFRYSVTSVNKSLYRLDESPFHLTAPFSVCLYFHVCILCVMCYMCVMCYVCVCVVFCVFSIFWGHFRFGRSFLFLFGFFWGLGILGLGNLGLGNLALGAFLYLIYQLGQYNSLIHLSPNFFSSLEHPTRILVPLKFSLRITHVSHQRA